MPKNYWNPYLAGLLLGLTLLAAFMVAGQGLGASAAPKRIVALGCETFNAQWAGSNTAINKYFQGEDAHPLKNWLILEVVGVLLGGFIGAVSAGRLKGEVVRGPRISVRGRLLYAFFGGAIMGLAAAIGRGCTSGQALSGGGTLAAGGWAYMMMFFGGAYALAWVVRRQWT
ncbi:YeeE/YedE family protein [bacterium]|nr:YeeE/YedE family protein [bacterium]